jgi:phospholipase/carboxylesterase
LLIALHGYAGDMTSMFRVAHKIAGGDMIAVCPQGPHQFWVPSVDAVDSRRVGFGWLTHFRAEDSQKRHHELLERMIRSASKEWGADLRRIFLLGFSQACALNYRFAFTHPDALRGVIGVCGGIPGDFDDPKYERISGSVLHIAARRDPYYATKKTRAFQAPLRERSRDVTYKEYDAEHVFPRRSIPAIRSWILDRC